MLAQRDNTPAAAPEPEATPETEPEYTFGEEATKVLSDKWEGFTGSVATGVAALPFVGDDAARAQARADVWQGVKDQYNGLRALSGPNIFDLGESAIGLVTGDPEKAAAVSEQWDETKNAWSSVADNTVNSWNEAEQRNGTLGALEMSAAAIGSELLGGAASTAGRLGHAAEDASDIAKTTRGFSQLSSDARKYLNDLELQTGFKVNPEQRAHLANALREKEFSKLSPGMARSHHADFNRKKDTLISQWEENTGQSWPHYTEDVISSNGVTVSRKAGKPYDAHHIIESSYGGPNEWWNMHPARFPDQHQGGIHRSGSISKKIFSGD